MRRLLPADGAHPDDDGLLAHYAYPDGPDAPYVRVNFVSSLDGAVSVDGLSGGLGSDADKAVFGALRRLADVVLVGAGTARAEDYRGARRPTLGRDLPPPIAVVTGSADLDPGARLFTDTAVAPIVLTTAGAPAARREALRAAGADVVEAPDLEPATLLTELGRRGLTRVLCEGGPSLFGALAGAGLVDELCLTLSPVVVAGSAGRITAGPTTDLRLELAGVLHADDALLLRYTRGRGRPNG
ncbi:pyrimidine reductase family protein [Pseudonocardia sp. N23]|uniref:pyrimidine reductase family protein n=1 Tax=Pseudonocardia sp. N23 TaxID=1987376 RepID=UPI000BFEA183|nr:pyrimidine reductase family protein [Pseudonocardia sp. N23]GAY10539.1 5-amino-6-(5-phosphoribosylamino)uracil reductase homolog [Pseudonocardia sp. N23]